MTGEPAPPEPTRRQWVGYWSMIVQQTQNAFNDKMAQFILIPLAGAIGFVIPVWPGVGVGLESIAGLMISLPFVLFAPVAGWLSDRFSKRDVMLGAAVAQLVILGWISLAVWTGNMWMALSGFFGLAIQSAFFSPAKMGINKELVGSKHLGFATGIQQMTAMLAILVGQIVAGKWFDGRWESLGGGREQAWSAGLLPLVILLISAVPAVVLASIVPRVPAQGGPKFAKRLVLRHFANLADLWSHPGLRRAACGVAFFWGIAAFINLWSIKLAKHLTDGGKGFGSLSSDFMAAASLGMAVGFGCAAYLLRKRIELGWVPIAGGLMAVMSLSFLFLPFGGWVFMVALALLAFAAALFLAPLNAWLQDNYPANKRGEFQAAVNLLDCLAGILSVALIEGILWGGRLMGLEVGLVMRLQMVFGALACVVATIGILRMLPSELLGLVSNVVMGFCYRVRASHPERMPATGGVLVLSNHVSFIDACLLHAASPRRLRFVMEERYADRRTIGFFTRLFDTVLIRRDHPLEAIRVMIAALKRGEAVCYFPEGQLSRTGCLSPLQRGVELIVAKAEVPVLPVWIGGIWGSVFTYERNRFFTKVPYLRKLNIAVAFGEAMAPADVDRTSVRDALAAVSVESLEERFCEDARVRRLSVADGPLGEVLSRWDEEERRLSGINGDQVARVNALQPGEPVHVWRQDPMLNRLAGVLVSVQAWSGVRVVVEENVQPVVGQTWLGGEVTREQLAANASAVPLRFYDFGKGAGKGCPVDGVESFPCLQVDGRVLAMSMPQPAEVAPGFDAQTGRKPRAVGHLLPGWVLRDGSVFGPAAPGGLKMPAGYELDADGFVVSL